MYIRHVKIKATLGLLSYSFKYIHILIFVFAISGTGALATINFLMYTGCFTSFLPTDFKELEYFRKLENFRKFSKLSGVPSLAPSILSKSKTLTNNSKKL